MDCLRYPRFQKMELANALISMKAFGAMIWQVVLQPAGRGFHTLCMHHLQRQPLLPTVPAVHPRRKRMSRTATKLPGAGSPSGLKDAASVISAV